MKPVRESALTVPFCATARSCSRYNMVRCHQDASVGVGFPPFFFSKTLSADLVGCVYVYVEDRPLCLLIGNEHKEQLMTALIYNRTEKSDAVLSAVNE